MREQFDDEEIPSWVTRDGEKVRKTLPRHSDQTDGKVLLEAVESFEYSKRDAIADFQEDTRVWGRDLIMRLEAVMRAIADDYGFDPMHLKTAWETACREGIFGPDMDDVPMPDRHRFDLGQFYRMTLDHVRVLSAEASAFAWEKMRDANDPHWREDIDEGDM